MSQDRPNGRLESIEQMMGLGGVPRSRRRLYRFFVIVILLSGLCYCVGFVALALAPANPIASALTTPTATSAPVVINVTAPAGFLPSPIATPYIPPTFTPSPAASPTETMTATPMLTPTLTPTATSEPTPTSGPTTTYEPTATFTPTAMPEPTVTSTPSTQPTPPLPVYQILIATQADDSLFVINESADAFPLEPLRLGDGQGAIDGSEWNIAALDQGACVTAWSDSRNPRSPRVKCSRVGTRLTRSGADRFWGSAFNVYYAGELVGVCQPERCSFNINVQ